MSALAKRFTVFAFHAGGRQPAIVIVNESIFMMAQFFEMFRKSDCRLIRCLLVNIMEIAD